MQKIIHDSHNLFYRKPFGAVPCGTTIQLRISVYEKEADMTCHLQVYEGLKSKQIKMMKEADEEKINFVVQYEAPEDPCVVWYSFVIQLKEEKVSYGNNWDKLGGEGTVAGEYTPTYQITVYDNKRKTPQWFKHAVMYQIFPERFNNGNDHKRINSPKSGSLIHGDWNDTPYYIKDREGRVVRWDFFGGNLKGIEKKLNYLKSLGTDVIYLNPIFEAASNHKYDTGDYKKIDPMFGSMSDFINLIKEGEAVGIRFILDGVFSHTGSESIYFNEGGKYPGLGAYQSKSSPYYNWYKFTDYPREYESWWGVGTLPNVNEMEPAYQDFIYKNHDSVVRYWIHNGAKGWRLDVADELPDEFIKGIKEAMISTDEESVLIGEVWEDASNKVSYDMLRQYLLGFELDSVMNYPFRGIFIDFLLGKISPEMAYRKLMSLYENYPKEIFYSCINLIGTHDTERILTILGEAEAAEKLNDEQRERYRLSSQKRLLGIKRLKMLVLVQMTFPGVPCIYYGDEAGMEGYADPYNRGPFPWEKENQELMDWYKKAIQIRKSQLIFIEGSWEKYFCENDLFGYLRQLQQQKAICLFNRSCDQAYNMPLMNKLYKVKDLLLDKEIKEMDKILIKPLEARILLIEEK